jgi:regulation of enolase protein 1 (concanavalin A-like superfamily)
MTANAQPAENGVVIAALPWPLRWLVAPERWTAADDSLTIAAGPTTDLFVDPTGSPVIVSAPSLVGDPAGDFLLSARVTVGFGATFDAGVLVLHANDHAWAKLCFECSPDGTPMVVSVVTRGVSDDCNSFEVDGDQVWLRVARMGPAFAFHASTDGARWRLIRHFALDPREGMAAGFLAQSPTGPGCTATFDAIRFRQEQLADIRSGE